jgi:hypothetical protein
MVLLTPPLLLLTQPAAPPLLTKPAPAAARADAGAALPDAWRPEEEVPPLLGRYSCPNAPPPPPPALLLASPPAGR